MQLKRVTSFLLALCLCALSPLSAYAGSISGGSSAGQGDGGIGDATSSSGNGTWKLPGGTGFRFTVVDANGNPVSNIKGQGIGSLDVVNSSWKQSGELWTACATAPLQGMSDYYVYPLSMSEFLSYINESGHDFKWINSNEDLFGDEVREFILKGTKSTSEIDGSGGLDSNTNPDSGSVSNKPSLEKQLKIIEGWKLIFASWKEKSKDKSNEESLLNEIKTKRDINLTTDVMRLNGVNEWNLLGYFNNCVHEVLSNLGYNPDDNAFDNLYFYWDSKTKEQFPDAYNLYQEYKNFLKNRNKQTKQASNKKSGLDLFTLFGGLTAYAAPADNNSGSSSTSGINTVNVDETSVLAKIINLQVDGNYVFQLEGSAKTVAEQKQGAKSPLIVFTENSYVLLVEATIQGCPQGWNTKLNKAGTSYKSLVYGTAHNWAMFGVSSSFKNSSAYSPSFGNHKRYLGQALPNALVTVSDWTDVLGKPQKSGQYVIADMQNLFRTGYGCHLYTTVDLVNPDLVVEKIDVYPGDWGGGNGIHTYDITTNPKTDYTTEPTTNKKDKDSYGEKSNKFKIAKYYRYKDDISGKVTEISYYTVSDAPHTVQILNEQAQTGFSLKEWFTSTDNWLPDGGKAPSVYGWESVIKGQHKSGQYSGTTEQLLTVKETDNDNVLHLLYEFTGKPFINIVKVYKNANDEIIKTTGPEVSEDNSKYTVTDEPDYDYVETLISTKDPDVNNPEGVNEKEKEINIPQGTKTLYIIYKEPPHQIKLFSNELSYTYELKDLVKSRILFSIYDTVPASPGTSPSCGGHGISGRRCRLRSHAMVDSLWSVKVSNNYNYNSTSFIREYENTGNLGGRWSSGIGGKSITANSSQVAKPNGTFSLIRDNIDDLVMLYPHKNNNLKNELSGLGITAESYTSSQSRMGSESIKDKAFTRTFVTDFVYTEHDTNLSWKWPRSKCNRNHGGSYSTQTVTDVVGANKYYSNQNNVKEFYLLGQSNTGDEKVSDARSDTFGTKYSYNKAYSSISADLKFYPYHLMLYRAKNANNSPQNVYVTSENLSTMKVYNAVQLGVYKKNPINALLSSTQWSTHARSLAFSANTDKKSVLPGGAILDLDMGSKGDTELGIRLWQSCLRDEQVETVQPDGFTTSLSKAKEIATNYQSEVKSVLEGYGLVQWGTEGVETDLNGVLSSGVELHNNTSLDWDGRSYNSSNDSKYYLKHDGSGSDRANFDVLDNKITKQVFYEISSDVDGNVILKKDNTEIARASLSQGKSSILSNTEAKLLDDNTKLISNYFSSIDRGLGDRDKYDRTNSRKYNEAFDGVGVLMTELSFAVGFSDNSGHRTTVLDTLLTSSSDSKSDLYNFDESKVRSFVFATTELSTTAKESKNGYIGTLSGDGVMGSLSSVLSDIQSFVYSKNFYTSNFNVTDLN